MTQPTDPKPDPKPADPAPPAGDPPTDKAAEGLGDAGKKALDEERKARKAAEAELVKFRKADQERADADKTEAQKLADRATAAEKAAADAEARALRLEVAQAKGLTAGQAKRLQGSSREELEADADELLEAFPAKPAAPGTPKPDPSQGARGSGAPDIDARIAQAQKDGDYRTVIRLQNEKFAKTN